MLGGGGVNFQTEVGNQLVYNNLRVLLDLSITFVRIFECINCKGVSEHTSRHVSCSIGNIIHIT